MTMFFWTIWTQVALGFVYYPLQCIDGHSLGVDEPIEPTPAVFPPKGDPAIDTDTLPPMDTECPNYGSAADRADKIRQAFSRASPGDDHRPCYTFGGPAVVPSIRHLLQSIGKYR